MKYDAMKQAIQEYNRDDGLSFPEKVLNAPECDLALALEIFILY